MKAASEIVLGLWAGPYQALHEIEEMKGLETIISILPLGRERCNVTARAIRAYLALEGFTGEHRILVMDDDEPQLGNASILHCLKNSGPMLIHCNGGRNRSSMLAACWLILMRSRSGPPHTTPDEALEFVKQRRLPQFKEGPGREFYQDPNMIQTVHRFAKWLKEKR